MGTAWCQWIGERVVRGTMEGTPTLCCLLSFTKVNTRPDFVSTFVSSLLMFSAPSKTYLLIRFRGCEIFLLPTFDWTPGMQHHFLLPTGCRGSGAGLSEGWGSGKQVQVLSWIRAPFSLEAVWIRFWLFGYVSTTSPSVAMIVIHKTEWNIDQKVKIYLTYSH